MYQLVFNLTPFYPEGGGQVGDKGYLEDAHGDVVYILDTKKENNVIIHLAKNLPKHLNESFKAVVIVNTELCLLVIILQHIYCIKHYELF